MPLQENQPQRELRRQNEYLAALHETTLALMNRLELADLLEVIVIRAGQLLGTPNGAIYLVDSFEMAHTIVDHSQLEDDAHLDAQPSIGCKIGVGALNGYIGQRMKLGEGLAGKVWQTGRPIIVADYDRWPGRSPNFDYNRLGAIMGVPLKSGSRTVGVISQSHNPAQGQVPQPPFDSTEVELLERFAQLASIALDNARLYTAARKELIERQRAEIALQKAHDELEQRVEERTAELMEANIILQNEIAERERIETALWESEEETRLIIDTALDAVITMDEQGKITGWNGQAEAIFGWTQQEAIGQVLASLIIPHRHREAHERGLQRFLATGTSRMLNQRLEITAIDRTQREFPIELSISPVYLQETTIFNAFVRDISDRKRAQQLMEDYNRTLANEVAERTQALSLALKNLQATQAQLVEAEKMAALGGLVAGIAHEINTPVGIGVTAASLLKERTYKLHHRYLQQQMTRSDLEKFFETAIQSSNILMTNLGRAADLIQSFKQVAADQSSEERRTFPVKLYLNEILLSLRPKLKRTDHHIDIQADDNLFLDSYPGAFSQIVTNLVLNSLTHAYAPECYGTLTFKLTHQSSCIRFEYSDDGQGIGAEYLGKIFDPFFTTKRGQGGSGLGLHIVYNLVTQRLGGTIRCESEIGVGTHFTIDIPTEKEKVERGK